MHQIGKKIKWEHCGIFSTKSDLIRQKGGHQFGALEITLVLNQKIVRIPMQQSQIINTKSVSFSG